MRIAAYGSGLRWRTARSKLGLGLLVFYLATVWGCAPSERDFSAQTVVTTVAPTSPHTSAEPAPSGTSTWVLDLLDGRPLLEGTVITLRMEENWFGGVDGCNDYEWGPEEGLSILRADGVFSVSSLSLDEALCWPEGIMEQAEAYISAFTQGESYRLVGDRLEILDDQETVRLVFFREEPLPGQTIDLRSTLWRLPMGNDTNGEAPLATLAFVDDRRVLGVTPCRAYLATYTRSEGSLRFPSRGMLSYTTDSCSEESQRLESQFIGFLGGAWEYSVNEESGSTRLRIRTDRRKTLTFEPLLPNVKDLANSEWTFTTFVEFPEKRAARITPVIQGTEVTLYFAEDSISGRSGCNFYEGPASTEDGRINVQLEHTEMACDGPEGLMEQEDRFLDHAREGTQYGVYGDRLFLRTDEDMFLLFQAREAG